MPSLRSSLVAAATGVLALLATPAAAQTRSSLAVAQGKPPMTFDYSTTAPDRANWIGIYDTFFGGPDNDTFVAPSLAWVYAPESRGSVQISMANLSPGTYRAYFLARDDHVRLVRPIEAVVPGQNPMAFMVGEFTTQNARRGDRFGARIKGLLANAPDANVQYAKVGNEGDGGDWVQVAPDGTLTGTPDAAGEKRIVVQATGSNGARAQLRVKIPVREARTPLVEQINVLSFNIWQGGRNVNDGYTKQVRYLAATGADIVGFQESNGGFATRLGDALGWFSWQGPDVGIISRYPIVEVFQPTEVAGAVRVALDGRASQVIVWNAHLAPFPYGPYEFCFDKKPVDQVLQQEDASGRTRQIQEIVGRMRDQINNAANIPVILTGDFNAPSHLDWTNAARQLHCNAGDVPWPSSVEPNKAGLIDSYRELHPDPVADRGDSWSPIFLNNEGRQEPLDRIDFVYHKGLQTVESRLEVVGQPKAEPNHRDNEWPSDHAAVKTTFRLPVARRNRRTRSVRASQAQG